MVSALGDQLPKFTAEESQSLIGSYDFMGINYYTTMFAANLTPELVEESQSTGGADGVNSIFKIFNVVLLGKRIIIYILDFLLKNEKIIPLFDINCFLL